VTRDDIQTRAYFHFENRTGTNWQDPEANWSQAEAEETVLATARALDITSELFTFRPLSQMIPIHVVPSIDTKIASGILTAQQLPIELNRLQILWPATGLPIVQINDEVQIRVEGTARRAVEAGDPIYINDLVPGSERLVPPSLNDTPVAYLLLFSLFMDLRFYFDFSPNAPDWNPAHQRKPSYEFQEIALRTHFMENHPPKTFLLRLKQLGWPPSASYYPVLVQTMQQPGGDSPASIAATIVAMHGAPYWTKRIALWSELDIFSTRTTYVRKAVEEYLEGDYVSAIYVAVPQFEGIIKDYVLSSGGAIAGKFRDTLSEFKRLIESRKVLLFPRFALDLVLDFIDNGSFWNNTSTITDPSQEIDRHGIVHGVFTGFETQELALKCLLLLDCLAIILLQDQLVRGVLK